MNSVQPLLWRVELSSSHAGYTHTYLKNEYEGKADWVVVVVNLSKLMQYFERDTSYVVEPVEKWEEKYRKEAHAFLNPSTGAPYMPRVSHLFRDTREKWMFWRFTSEFVISFSNGRHRARYLQFAGATDIPVLCSTNSVQQVSAYCGGDPAKCPTVVQPP
jgi:hypothetical protein